MLSRLASDLSIGDWDGDGDLDVLHSNPLSPAQYFEQSEGQLVLLEGPKSPFYEIANLTVTHRPIMADWNGDGNMDLVLLAKFVGTSDIDQDSLCTSYLYEQHKIGGKTALVFKDETFFRNEGCSSFDGSGASFVDVDKDGDLDAICGSYNGPLRVYNHTAAGLVKPNKFPSNSIPLDMIQLESEMSGKHLNFLHPVLADWDLDGDLDLALLHPLGHKHPEKNRYFLHLPDDTVTELNGPPNSSCPIDWGRHFSVADFDGDGKNDLLCFASHRGDGTDDLVGYLGNLVVVCLQTSSGFVVVEPEKIPFNYLSNCPQCLTNVSWIVLYGGFPSFLDWDGDGDLDVLRKNLADQALSGLGFEVRENQKFYHKVIPFEHSFSICLMFFSSVCANFKICSLTLYLFLILNLCVGSDISGFKAHRSAPQLCFTLLFLHPRRSICMSSCPMAQFSPILSPFPQHATFQLQILIETVMLTY